MKLNGIPIETQEQPRVKQRFPRNVCLDVTVMTPLKGQKLRIHAPKNCCNTTATAAILAAIPFFSSSLYFYVILSFSFPVTKPIKLNKTPRYKSEGNLRSARGFYAISTSLKHKSLRSFKVKTYLNLPTVPPLLPLQVLLRNVSNVIVEFLHFAVKLIKQQN